MDEILTIAFVQFDISWESKEENFEKIENFLSQESKSYDLLLLPEMFSTGFSMNASELAEDTEGHSFKWMKNIASQYACIVVGSIIVKEEGIYYNRCLVVNETGILAKYDKRHLFHPGNEHAVYTMGQDRITFDCKGFRIFPQICYDLRFPVYTRNDADYDLLFFIASWPKARIDNWNTLLKARAIENQAYCIGVNRLGEDGNGLEYNGMSSIYAYDGKTLLSAEEKEGVFLHTINKDHLKFRQKLNFLSDRDSFQLEM